MKNHQGSQDVNLDRNIEALIKDEMIAHYTKEYPNVISYVEMLMDIDGYRDRFQYFFSTVDGENLKKYFLVLGIFCRWRNDSCSVPVP
jgi:hypothetical protein